MDSTSALSSLIERTNKTLGFVPSTPSEFDEASLKIEKVIKTSFSTSSLKRLWGYVDYTNEPAKSTLNKLARYNGFPDYQTFIDSLMADDSGFLEDSLISTDRVAVGDRLLLSWNDGKECLLHCIAPRRFRVETSKNIKLQEGDTLTLHIIGIGHPVYATDIVRGGEHISAYHGAKKGGLRSFRHLTETTKHDSLTTRICEGLREAKMIQAGKMPAKSARAFLDEL